MINPLNLSAKLYLVLAIFCLVMIAVYPYLTFVGSEDNGFIRAIMYSFDNLSHIMIYSFVTPMVFAFILLIIMIAGLLKKISALTCYRLCVINTVAIILIIVSGLIISNSLYWIFISILPMLGVCFTLRENIRKTERVKTKNRKGQD